MTINPMPKPGEIVTGDVACRLPVGTVVLPLAMFWIPFMHVAPSGWMTPDGVNRHELVQRAGYRIVYVPPVGTKGWWLP